MIQSIYKFSITSVALITLLLASCGDTKTYSTYQCPMKCEQEKTYDKAGKCPVCGMDLEGVEAKK